MRDRSNLTEMTRRGLFSRGAALIGLSGLGLWVLRRDFAGYGSHTLARVFNRSVANSSAAQDYLQAFSKQWLSHESGAHGFFARFRYSALFPFGAFPTQKDLLDTQLVTQFVMSTNITAHQSTGEALDFYGLYDPYLSVCGNPLSALRRD